MDKLNYRKGQDDDRFSRFRSNYITSWPIDLMYVNNETFTKMLLDSKELVINDIKINVVSPRHLAMLKIHALKFFQSNRFSKYFSDLYSLLKSGECSFSPDELLDVCEKYANRELYEKLKDVL